MNYTMRARLVIGLRPLYRRYKKMEDEGRTVPASQVIMDLAELLSDPPEVDYKDLLKKMKDMT